MSPKPAPVKPAEVAGASSSTAARTDGVAMAPKPASGKVVGRRASRQQATRIALRRAALRLIEARGYDATRTDDIAHAAGVSPRTFFNYFPTKESAVFPPEGLLARLAAASLRSRPAGEDPLISLAVAARDTLDAAATMVGTEDQDLFVGSLRLMVREPVCRQILWERRARVEDTAWAAMQERGIPSSDLAVRSAVTSVVSLAFLSLTIWVETDGAEGLTAILARCLSSAPDPGRLATGLMSKT
jgi:AcrR family transcriptional regulator